MIFAQASVVALFLLAVVVINNVDASNNNSPLCRKPEDFIRDWAVKNDPKRYWKCTHFGVAELRECLPGREFSDRYSMCTVPGAILGDIDVPAVLIPCEPGQSIDLSGDPSCVSVPCENGLIVYNPEGHPVCYKDPSQIQLCPGAPEDRRTFGTEQCGQPECTLEQYLSGQFYPSTNPNEFYRCAHEKTPVMFKCYPGLCFDAQSNACVWPVNWRNACA